MYLTNYAHEGLQARARITFLKPLAFNDYVRIIGFTYSYGIHFTGTSPAELARSLTASINGPGENFFTVPNKTHSGLGFYYAVCEGNSLLVISTIPGAGGNQFPISTNAASKVVVPATFTGGHDKAQVLEAPADPLIVTGINEAKDAYNNPDLLLKNMYIQNLGVTPIKYAMNSTATALNFHGIIAAGSSIDDGTGAMMELVNTSAIVQVSLFSTGAFRASVVKFF